jgi:hypothetical protein
MTDLTDVVAKETYYRYLVKSGVKPETAEVEVIDAFPDYKEGLPLRLKQMSDLGIIPFPRYFFRVQRNLARLAIGRPATVATDLAIENYVDTNLPTIVDSSVLSIWNSSFRSTLRAPWSYTGWGSVFPMHLF